MDEISSPSGSGSGSGAWRRWVATATSKYQHLLDITTPHRLRRWVAFGVAALIYLARVCWIEGFYIITYALGIYILNLMIGFLSPQIDPEIERPPPLLPVHHPHPHPDEFKPFVRLLPEFKLWYSLMKAFCLAFLMTFFPVFDVPVFWPILVVYWIVLFVMTIKRQVLHMIKYRYVPFTVGKQKYGGKKPATQKVQQQKLEADQLEQPV